MHKFLSNILYKYLLFLMVFLFTPLRSFAQTVIIGDLSYYLDSHGTASVRELANTEITDLVIPESISYNNKNYPVTMIDWYAFKDRSNLSSVTIPNSVTSIDSYAFNGCTSLSTLRIEDGQDTLNLEYNYYSKGNGKGLFYDCPLESLYLGRDLSYKSTSDYGYSPFYNKKNLTSLTIGNSVTSIKSYTFSGCAGLTSITIPNSVTSIGDYAFF